MDLTNEEIILAGLGSAKGRTNTNTGVKVDIGSSQYRKHFIERMHMLPKAVQDALRDGSAEATDSPYYFTAEAKGTRVEMVRTSVSEELGITNVDNGKLGKDRYLVLSGLKLLYDGGSAEGSFTDTYPAALINGEWELILNGRKKQEKMPVRKFFDGIYGYDSLKPFGLYILDNPKIIDAQTPMEFNLDLPTDLGGHLKLFLEGVVVNNS